MKTTLSLILAIFTLNVLAFTPDPNLAYQCKGDELYSKNGKFIYRFSYSSDCEEALRQSAYNQGRFCDGKKLVKEDGTVLNSFSFHSNCPEAFSKIMFSRKGLYCSGKEMFNVDLIASRALVSMITVKQRFRMLVVTVVFSVMEERCLLMKVNKLALIALNLAVVRNSMRFTGLSSRSHLLSMELLIIYGR